MLGYLYWFNLIARLGFLRPEIYEYRRGGDEDRDWRRLLSDGVVQKIVDIPDNPVNG